MGINTVAVDELGAAAIKHFWDGRRSAADSQKQRGISDQGNRSSVTSGKNLDGFVKLVGKLVVDNGLKEHDIFVNKGNTVLPGFFRPLKNWDLAVIHNKQLIAAVEFKSQVGPSFGNNFNNRVEEALGNATDILTAFENNAFGESSKPFLGYVFVLEESPLSTRTVSAGSPHFAVLPEFSGTSYAERYEILCRKLVQEQLYDAAALILTSQADSTTGTYHDLSELTSLGRFASLLASKIAATTII